MKPCPKPNVTAARPTPTPLRPTVPDKSASSEILPITVVVAVRNEEKNLPDCLRSVARMDQVFVIDSHSADRTCEIAQQYGAEVVQFDYNGGWPKKRNWALRALPIRNAWVLVLDGDERVDDSLFREISQAIYRPNINGYYLRWKFIFLGRWMKHCWSHGWMLRLFRHGTAEYEDLGLRGEGGWDAEVHENVVLHKGKADRLKSWLTHDTREDLTYWIHKQNEFSSWNAARRLEQLREPPPPLRTLFLGDPMFKRKWLKSIFIRLPARSLMMFVWLYIVKRGFLDGKAGYYFCRLRAIHEFNITVKMYELHQKTEEAEKT